MYTHTITHTHTCIHIYIYIPTDSKLLFFWVARKIEYCPFFFSKAVGYGKLPSNSGWKSGKISDY